MEGIAYARELLVRAIAHDAQTLELRRHHDRHERQIVVSAELERAQLVLLQLLGHVEDELDVLDVADDHVGIVVVDLELDERVVGIAANRQSCAITKSQKQFN